MTVYTIEGFWQPRLPVKKVERPDRLVSGWSMVGEGLPSFQEAPLTLSDEFGVASDPGSAPLILVSAPGAVGKSTLAREIAYRTGVIYIDLAKAEPVGGNTVSGGLLRSAVHREWELEQTTLLIDGLDEARLRVTQSAFEAFLSDIATLAASRSLPVVMFGRTGSIQDAWIVLADQIADVPVLEIGYYGEAAALAFAKAWARIVEPIKLHTQAEDEALSLLLARLREQTEKDGDRFAGYAPVIQAVAESVAKESNPAALVSRIKQGDESFTLQSVVSAILDRERGKLQPLPFDDSSLVLTLYSADEQLDRLAARIYGLPSPQMLPMSAADAKTYATALETWVPEHPFLSGGSSPSSAVFGGLICAHALKRGGEYADVALDRELGRGAAANPFLPEFYISNGVGGEVHFMPPEHVGVVYAALRARLSLGDTANLSVEGPEDVDDEEALRAEVEINVARRGVDRPRVMIFETEQMGRIRLGSHLEDIEISAPHSTIEIGPGDEITIISPVFISCESLVLTAAKLIVEESQSAPASIVFLEAAEFQGPNMSSVPAVRGAVGLSVSWPGASAFPWTSFAVAPRAAEDSRVDEALRRLRKFVVAFRSHSKGSLARIRDKLEHSRMTKGSGRSVLDQMVEEDIVSLQGQMYHLDPDRLAQQTGASYVDVVARSFGERAVAFVKRALAQTNS